MSNKNLTKTLFADFRKVDTKKLNINGNPFSEVVSGNVPETPTNNDIWKYAVTTDDNGVVTVTDDVAVDYSEMTGTQKTKIRTAAIVEDNKAYLDTNKSTLVMNWDTKNFTNENNGEMNDIFNSSKTFTAWNSDLSSLTNSTFMFDQTGLKSFSGDLSSLENGRRMFGYTPLTSFDEDLPSLTNSNQMFINSTLASFNGDLSSLTNGYAMFTKTNLKSFNGDLSSLTNGNSMFKSSTLQSFNNNLPSLVDGGYMFYETCLASFSGDLSSLINGASMFYRNALASFSGDLSSLVNGHNMFGDNYQRDYGVKHWKMVEGKRTEVTETFESNGLKSFISNLSSLKCGYHMFGSGNEVTYTYTDDSGSEVTKTIKAVAPLDEESIMLIADTINDVNSLDDWTYTACNTNGSLITQTISSGYRKKLHLGYDSSITDITNIKAYCDEIVAKGWTVYLNGSEHKPTKSGSVALIDGESSAAPIPHYYKPVQVTDEEIAEYVDGNGNFYIIVGAQHVFGDDISTYGMFTSYEHAVSEITTALGLTPYVKPAEESEI